MGITLKSTKDQVMKAYQDAEKAKKDLESQLAKSQKEANNAKEDVEKIRTQLELLKQQLQQTKNGITNGQTTPAQQIIIKESNLQTNTVKGILNVLENIEKGLGNAISEISIELSREADVLADLRKKTKETADELKNLYNLEMFENLLDTLITQYQETQKQFEESNQKRQKEFQEEIQELSKNWNKEKEKYALQIFERNEKNHTEYQRELQDFEYDLKQARNIENDIYEQKRKQLQIEIDEIKEIKNNTWQEREKLLKEKEENLAKYKKDFEEFPEKLEKEIKKAEAEGKAIVEKEAKVKFDLASKEVESRNKMYEMKVLSLTKTIENQENIITKLNLQLESALKQAQELAVKAIEGSSNLDKFNAVREIATEMAKNQPKNK